MSAYIVHAIWEKRTLEVVELPDRETALVCLLQIQHAAGDEAPTRQSAGEVVGVATKTDMWELI
jgi:hypothetical protein